MNIKTLVLAGGTALMLGLTSTAGFAAEDHGKKQGDCPPFCMQPTPPSGGGNPPPPPPPDSPPPPGGGHHGGGQHGGGHHNHGRDRWDPYPWWSYDYGWRPNYYYSDPYYYRDYSDYYYDEQPVLRSRLSCASAKRIVQKSGYRSVVAVDCQGKSYGFKAKQGKHRYKITVSARTGQIIGRQRL